MVRRLLCAGGLALALVAPACGGGDDGDADLAAGHVRASFYVYFTSRADAREAIAELRDDGFSTEMRVDEGVEWLVIASRHVPREELEDLEAEMRYVAWQFEGDYDGSDIEGDD